MKKKERRREKVSYLWTPFSFSDHTVTCSNYPVIDVEMLHRHWKNKVLLIL